MEAMKNLRILGQLLALGALFLVAPLSARAAEVTFTISLTAEQVAILEAEATRINQTRDGVTTPFATWQSLIQDELIERVERWTRQHLRPAQIRRLPNRAERQALESAPAAPTPKPERPAARSPRAAAR